MEIVIISNVQKCKNALIPVLMNTNEIMLNYCLLFKMSVGCKIRKKIVTVIILPCKVSDVKSSFCLKEVTKGKTIILNI